MSISGAPNFLAPRGLLINAGNARSANIPLTDVTNQSEAPPQVSHPSGPKWTHLPRTDTGKLNKQQVHTSNKRILSPSLDHSGLQKKTKIVSPGDKENVMGLVEASFQPSQGS